MNYLYISLEILKQVKGKYVVIFIDLKKAFDSVRQADIFNILMEKRVPKDIIELLMKIYEKD